MSRATACCSMYSLMSMRIMRLLVSNRNCASVLHSSVLPTPVGPRKRNDPIGSRILRARRARGTASETARTASSWPTTRSCELVLHVQQLLALALDRRETGMPVQRATTSAISSAVDLLAQQGVPLGLPAASVSSAAGEALVQLGQLAVLELGRPVRDRRGAPACSSSVCLRLDLARLSST